MAAEIRIFIGVALIVLNLLPFVVKKPKYLLVTSIISLIILFLLDKL